MNTEPEVAASDGPPQSTMMSVGVVFMVVAFFVGLALGKWAGPDPVDSPREFEWILALLGFAPFFVAGAVLAGAGAVLGYLQKRDAAAG